MLENTKNIRKELKEVGFELSDIRISNKWSRKNGCNTQITIFNDEKYLKFRIIRKLLKLGYGVSLLGKNLIIHSNYPLSGNLFVVKGNNIKTYKARGH